MIEPRVLLSAATYTGIASNGIVPEASSISIGTSFLSIFGGATAGATHGSLKQGYGAIEFDPGTSIFLSPATRLTASAAWALTLYNSSTSGNFGSKPLVR